MTRKQAIAMARTGWWHGKTAREICTLQLFDDQLCMPFDKFHGAVEKALGRPVWTHEFARIDDLRREFLGDRDPPTIEEILTQVPEYKRIIILKE